MHAYICLVGISAAGCVLLARWAFGLRVLLCVCSSLSNSYSYPFTFGCSRFSINRLTAGK